MNDQNVQAGEKLLAGKEGTPRFNIKLKPVFPSKQITIWGEEEGPEYVEPAHLFKLQNSTGFNNGEATYDGSFQELQFVKKLEDGTMIPGIQSEQLIILLISRLNSPLRRMPALSLTSKKPYIGCNTVYRNVSIVV